VHRCAHAPSTVPGHRRRRHHYRGDLLLLLDAQAGALNAKIEEICHYVEHAGFCKLAVDKQFVYLKARDERGDDPDAAYQQKKLSEDDYAAAKEYAWFGKQLSRMERYVAIRNAGERQKFLDKIIDRKFKPPAAGAQPPAKGDDDEPQVTRDQRIEKVLPLTWPRETREQWEQLGKALRDREKERLKATAATRNS
jgi:hypothetical protein